MKTDWKVLVVAFAVPCLASFGWKTGSLASEGVRAYFRERPQKLAAQKAQEELERVRNAGNREWNSVHCFVTGTEAALIGEFPEKTYGPVAEIRSTNDYGRTTLLFPWGATNSVKITGTKDCK